MGKNSKSKKKGNSNKADENVGTGDQTCGPLTIGGLSELARLVSSNSGQKEIRKEALSRLCATFSSKHSLSHSFRYKDGEGTVILDLNSIFDTMEKFVANNGSGYPGGEKKVDARSAIRSALEEGLTKSEAGDGNENSDWVLTSLALSLPLLRGALPRTADGTCVIPHPHPIVQESVPLHNRCLEPTGRVVFVTNKVCDNCDHSIRTQTFWTCAEKCDVDFCESCHAEMKKVFSNCDVVHAAWVVRFLTGIARQILEASDPQAREAFVKHLAFEWPDHEFKELVKVVVDVADASVVHVQDSMDIEGGTEFWLIVGLLQLLWSANMLAAKENRFGELAKRDPKVPRECFVLRGIDKCEANSDWDRWSKHQSKEPVDVVKMEPFVPTGVFACFLTHSNLVPLRFRRQCLLCDVQQAWPNKPPSIRTRKIQVRREPHALFEDLVESLNNREDPLEELLSAKFQGEDGSGPGVTREFLIKALQASLLFQGPRSDQKVQGGVLSVEAKDEAASVSADAVDEVANMRPKIWEYNEDSRTYWFSDTAEWPEAYYACGVILGQAILFDVLLPAVFPEALYAVLLHDVDSHQIQSFGPSDLATISHSTARGLEQLLSYDGDDVADVFSLDWPRAHECEKLAKEERASYVQAYIDWYFNEKFKKQREQFSLGFQEVLGNSDLLKSLVSASQLEQIICGTEVPLDVAAVQRSAVLNGWPPEDEKYLAGFWKILGSLSAEDLRKFTVFVSSSSRMPPGGWQDFSLQVQRNGDGDDRMPTAYTCFNLLLLPRYSSVDVMKTKLRKAIEETEGFGLQ